MLEVTEHIMKVINYESNQTTKYDNPAEVNHDVIWLYWRKYNYLFHLSPYNCDVHIKSRSQKLVIVEWAKDYSHAKFEKVFQCVQQKLKQETC